MSPHGAWPFRRPEVLVAETPVNDVVAELADEFLICVGTVLGEFNRSSQHFRIGGGDGCQETQIRSCRSCFELVVALNLRFCLQRNPSFLRSLFMR